MNNPLEDTYLFHYITSYLRKCKKCKRLDIYNENNKCDHCNDFFCDECSKEFTKEPLINRYWTFGYDQCCDKCYLIIQRQYF